MSAQDKMERILKQIHVAMAEGEKVSGEPDKVIVDRNEVFSILEQLNLAINEMMEEYEATSQARELAERRSEKKSEQVLKRVEKQVEDVYAASLVYTDDALGKIQQMMDNALHSSRKIWSSVEREIEKEQRKLREDQKELREQLQDFKDSNKYLGMIEECNREREKQEHDSKGEEKKIQNEAKHYSSKGAPEIKVNPAYFERRKQEQASKALVEPEIRVHQNAEYFRQQEKDAGALDEELSGEIVTQTAEEAGKRGILGKLERKFSL